VHHLAVEVHTSRLFCLRSEERDPGAMSGMRLLGRQWQRLVGTEVHSITPAALHVPRPAAAGPAAGRRRRSHFPRGAGAPAPRAAGADGARLQRLAVGVQYFGRVLNKTVNLCVLP
jgi:hypothetical protein